MVKRKRETRDGDSDLPNGKAAKPISENPNVADEATTVQIIAGSYERSLHGIVAHIPKSADSVDSVTFADSFLFSAHTSSIRCLALSTPSETQKVFLASGSTDERINIYSLTTVPPLKPQAQQSNGAKPTKHAALNALSRPTAMSAANKEVGTLNHHAATVTSLSFPTRTKLLSGATDNAIAVLRTRDWEVLSSLRAPIPKPAGRPSGDTAAPGEVPAGINDIAVHPSLKLMLTVGRGEKCMRLWNLVTGKKAGVLQFSKSLLAQVGEGRYGSGEGRKALWDAEGEEYVILFERGACVFGIDSKPRAVIRPQPPTKLHHMQYLQSSDGPILVISTEDGRLLFYNTQGSEAQKDEEDSSDAQAGIPICPAIAQLGGRDQNVPGRIKDFTILRQRMGEQKGSDDDDASGDAYFVVTACSDGAVQVWSLELSSAIAPSAATDGKVNGHSNGKDKAQPAPITQVGTMLGSYETGSRITCMEAFVMDGKPEIPNEADAVDDAEGVEQSDSEEDDDDSE